MLLTVLAFIGAAVLIVLLPGPDTLVVVRSILRGGRRQGVLTAVGNLCGLTVWVLAAALGLAAVLEASEVAAEVRPYAPDIERCYLDRLDDVRHAGRLALTFVIGRDGHVVSLDAAAPGLPARTVHQMAACIREVVDPIHFPARRADTTAIVPYLFQHTNTPGGGPQLSCWNPKGCH